MNGARSSTIIETAEAGTSITVSATALIPGPDVPRAQQLEDALDDIVQALRRTIAGLRRGERSNHNGASPNHNEGNRA